MAGVWQFLGGLGKVIEKVSTYIPGKVERLKQERAKLLKEQQSLQREVWNVERGQRLDAIQSRLADIEQLLMEKSKD